MCLWYVSYSWYRFSSSIWFSLTMGFIKMVSTVCGNLKIISLPYPTQEGAKEVSVIGILFKMEMSSLKMHASMILNASRMVPSTLKFTLRNACFQTSPLKTALTIWICTFVKTITWPIMVNLTNWLMMKTRALPGKMVQNPLTVNE